MCMPFKKIVQKICCDKSETIFQKGTKKFWFFEDSMAFFLQNFVLDINQTKSRQNFNRDLASTPNRCHDWSLIF